MYQYVEEEEEEEDYKNKMNNKIYNNEIYLENNSNKKGDNYNNDNNYNNYKFSPKKTKLNNYDTETISRNPNLNNYSKNKKFYIPINVMNLVSFINSQTNENNNSIPTLNILSKINNLENNITTNNNMNKYIPQHSLNNNFEDDEILKKYQQNYNSLKNQEILRQSAFTTQPFSPITNINNNNIINNFSVPYDINNKNKINNNNYKTFNNFNNNYNQNNSSLKFVSFNNVVTRKKKPPKNMKIKTNDNINNYYN